jgi:mRNA-degrading endonuclease HigB of HigAB toxin-antitoxin module
MAYVYTIMVYTAFMHVIAKPILVEFWTEYPDAEKPLQAWYRSMESDIFQNCLIFVRCYGYA